MLARIEKIYFNETDNLLICEGDNFLVLNIKNKEQIELNDIYLLECDNFFDHLLITKTQIQNDSIILKKQGIKLKLKSDFYKQTYFLQDKYSENLKYSGEKLLSIQCGGIILILNFLENQIFKTIQISARAQAISEDAKILAIDSFFLERKIILYDLEEGEQISSQNKLDESYSYATFITFVSNKILISASSYQAFIYEIKDGILALKEIIKTDNTKYLTSPSKDFFCIGFRNQMRFFAINKTQQLNFLKKEDQYQDKVASSLAVNFDEKYIAISFKNNLYIQDMDNGNQKKIFFDRIKSLDYSDKNQLIVCTPRQILLFIEFQFEKIGQLENEIRAMSCSKKNSLLVIADNNQKVSLWDISQKNQVALFQGHSEPVNSVDFSPDSKIIASSGEDKLIRLWDVNASKSIISQEGHYSCISSLKFSSDGLILASAGDVSIRLWNVQSKKCLAVLNQHKNIVISMDFSKDQNYLVSCDSNVIILWNIKNLNDVKHYIVDYLNHNTFFFKQVYFINDNSKIVSLHQEEFKYYSDSYKCVWDLKHILEFEFEFKIQADVLKFEFIPNTRNMVLIGQQKMFQIFDFEKKKYMDIQEHDNHIQFVSISQDWHFIVTLDANFIVLFWKNNQSKWMIDRKIILTSSFYQQDQIKYFKMDESQQKLNFITTQEFSQYDLQQNKEYLNEELINLNQDGAEISAYQIDHSYQIIAVAFYKDDDSEISLFKLEDFQKIKTFKSAVKQFVSISFSFNEKYLAAVQVDHTIVIWDYQNTQLFFEPIKNYYQILKIQFVKDFDENIIIMKSSIHDTKVFFERWNLKEFEIIEGQYKIPKRYPLYLMGNNRIFKKNSQVSPLGNCVVLKTSGGVTIKKIFNQDNFQFSFDERFLFVFQHGLLVIWDLKKKVVAHELKYWYLGEMSKISFSQDGQQILIISPQYKTLSFFEFKEGLEIISVNYYSFQHSFPSFQIIDNVRILMITKDNIFYFKKQNFFILDRLYFENHIQYPILSKNGYLFLNNKFKIYIYDITTKLINAQIIFDSESRIYLSNDEQFFVLTQGGNFRFVKFDQLQSYQSAYKFEISTNTITQVIISLDSKLLCAEFSDHSFLIWNIIDQKKPYLITVFYDNDNESEQKQKILFSYDSDYIAFNNGKQIKLFDFKRFPLKQLIPIFKRKVIMVTPFIQKNGKELQMIFTELEMFFYEDHQVKKKVIMNFTNKPSEILKFSKNYEILAYATKDYKDIILCYFNDLECDTSQNQKLIGHYKYIISLSFSSDSQLLISGSRDYSILIWNLKTLQCVASFKNLSDSVFVVEFSPDRLHFAAGLYDGNVELFISNTQEQSQFVKNRLVYVLKEPNQIGCIKSFSKQPLLQARNCNFKNTSQDQKDLSLTNLFARKTGEIQT